jgi:hypothetical protein
MSARALLAAIAAAVPLLFSGLAAGHGRDVPYHKSGGAYCYVEGSLGAIRAYPPVQMHAVNGTYDTVYWRAEVYRKRGGSWRRYITGMPRLSRTTDRSGRLNASLGPWMHWSRGTGHRFWRFTRLPRGIYRVGEIYRWSDGAVHTQWSLYSWNRNVSYQCEIS